MTTVAGSRALERDVVADRVRRLAEMFGIVAIAGALLLAFGLTSSQFLLAGNIRNIFVQISVANGTSKRPFAPCTARSRRVIGSKSASATAINRRRTSATITRMSRISAMPRIQYSDGAMNASAIALSIRTPLVRGWARWRRLAPS